jgi:hypothetical protein
MLRQSLRLVFPIDRCRWLQRRRIGGNRLIAKRRPQGERIGRQLIPAPSDTAFHGAFHIFH